MATSIFKVIIIVVCLLTTTTTLQNTFYYVTSPPSTTSMSTSTTPTTSTTTTPTTSTTTTPTTSTTTLQPTSMTTLQTTTTTTTTTTVSDVFVPECSFNTKCSCLFVQSAVKVNCTWDTAQFPAFSEFSWVPITQLTINIVYTGKETLIILPNFLYPLQSMENCTVLIQSIHFFNDCNSQPQLFIGSGAFIPYKQSALQNIRFKNVHIPNLGAGTFAYNEINGALQFADVCIDFVENYAFSGLTINSLLMGESLKRSTYMGTQSLVGINFFGSSEAQFIYLGINDTTPFKSINVTQLILNNNLIRSIPAFAFCSCNTCYNTVLQNLNLANNEIGANIFNDSFGNLPSLKSLDLSSNNIENINSNVLASLIALNGLYLDNNQLTNLALQLAFLETLSVANNKLIDVPVFSNSSRKLSYLDLSSNSIKRLVSNSFYFLTGLKTLNLESNPIVSIDPGAFNGVSSMTSLSLNQLKQLTFVDLLLSYGMTTLNSLSFQSCSLEVVSLIDANKLPPYLRSISFSYIYSLQDISPNIAQWLDSRNGFLDLNYVQNLPCNSNIQWMAKYYVCLYQIRIVSSYCEDGTTLQQYLEALQPRC